MNIERGMRGISDWLSYMNTNFRYTFGKDWDENGTTRGDIKTVSSDDLQRQDQLVATCC